MTSGANVKHVTTARYLGRYLIAAYNKARRKHKQSLSHGRTRTSSEHQRWEARELVRTVSPTGWLLRGGHLSQTIWLAVGVLVGFAAMAMVQVCGVAFIRCILVNHNQSSCVSAITGSMQPANSAGVGVPIAITNTRHYSNDSYQR